MSSNLNFMTTSSVTLSKPCDLTVFNFLSPKIGLVTVFTSRAVGELHESICVTC